jgi:signal transduction histidine kinase
VITKEISPARGRGIDILSRRMNATFILIRSIGILALCTITYLVPAIGLNHKLLAAVLLFIASPLSIIIEVYLPIRKFGWSEGLFDLSCFVVLVHLIPESWHLILLIGSLILGATGVIASRIGYKFYAFLFFYFVLGMSFAGYLHQVENWLNSILILSAVFPSILLFVKQQNDKMEQLYQNKLGLENLSLLAGGVVHDFNNMLTAVIENLELALMALPKNHASQKFIDDGLSATMRAALLSDQLLAFSGRKSEGKTVMDFKSEILSIAGSRVLCCQRVFTLFWMR